MLQGNVNQHSYQFELLQNDKNRSEYMCLVETLLVNFTKERGFDVTSICPLYIKHVFAFLKIDYLVSYAKEFLHGGVYRESG